MSLLDILTGGKSGEASDLERQAMRAFQGLQAPSAQALSLPELQQYVQAGVITPAQAQAYLQQNNALAESNISQTGTQAQTEALNRLSEVANAGAEGTPVQRAQVAQLMQEMNRNLAGQRGAINQDFQARGIPTSLLQAALAQQTAGQDAQAANQAGLQAQSQAYQTALNAMAQGGQLGGQLQGQQNQQANTVAQAQNAMQQFNAANQQNAAEANAARQQAANTGNTALQNQVSQQNTGLANQRTQYNTQVPQQVYQNQLQRAQGMAGTAQQAAQTAMQQGQQQAGLFGGLLGAGATLAGGAMGGPIGAAAANQYAGQGYQYGPPAGTNVMQYRPYAHGGVVEGYNQGGLCMDAGGMVPGQAENSGDSINNDTVHIMASPGEAVIPRSTVQSQPQEVLSLLAGENSPDPSPQDIATLLKAMKIMRGAI